MHGHIQFVSLDFPTFYGSVVCMFKKGSLGANILQAYIGLTGDYRAKVRELGGGGLISHVGHNQNTIVYDKYEM